MKYRTFGRMKWEVSEIGYGCWGLASWTGADQKDVLRALDLSIELGLNFFDTAWAYSEGKSENILRDLFRQHADKKLYIATKIPPRNFIWPSRREFTLDDCFPPEHIIEYTERSLKNLGVETIDLQQFHVWEDGWADDDRWKKAINRLKEENKIRAVGVSVNRWEPNNCLKTLKTGLIDAVQVIYNVFDQGPEDQLFPLCEELDIAIIARVPFDEGTLTGNLTRETTWPEDDWRSTYFVPENLESSVEHAERLKPLVPGGMTMAEMALRFILSNPTVSTIIPGMRSERHVRQNLATSDGTGLTEELLKKLKLHRWDREPTWWSQ
jgi:aryl-alcohol dehydrogenase-like predicted oxidoreductase